MIKTLLIFSFMLLVLGVSAKSYYVATTGNDSNAGTLENPLKTINSAVKKLKAGDILYVRGGTYFEVFNVRVSGTATNPITITAYEGELPVIDGKGTLPNTDWGNLINIDGSYIHISGFEVKNTFMGLNTGGLVVSGHHNIVSKFNVHHTYHNGILMKGDYGIVEDSKVWQACYNNVNGSSTRGWASGLSAARDLQNGITDHAILRRNFVYNNWGEGFSTYEAQGTIMEDNIIYDNWQVNVYISDAPNVIFQRNIIYNTPNNAVGKQGGGLWLADEVSHKPRSDKNIIINNFFLNTEAELFAWSLVPGSGLTNALIANNSFVNTPVMTGNTNSSSKIINNIFTSSVSAPASSGITWNNNLYQGVRPPNAKGSSDVFGSPLLAKTGSTAAGELSADYFKIISEISPAINKAAVLAEVPEDFFKATRNTTPDIGGHEFDGSVGILESPNDNSKTFRVYPIPAKESLTIELGSIDGNTQVQIFNMLGVLTKTLKVSSTIQHFNIEDLHSGIYFARLNESQNMSLRFIKL